MLFSWEISAFSIHGFNFLEAKLLNEFVCHSQKSLTGVNIILVMAKN